MDKISKALKKLTAKEKLVVKEILERIKNCDFSNLDLKKLKNSDDIFRVRKGAVRIIYRIRGDEIAILSVERRSDTTYKF